MTINQRAKHEYLIIAAVIFPMVLITMLLVFEYQRVSHHTAKLATLKKEYSFFRDELKRILADYTQAKERLAELETFLENAEIDQALFLELAQSTTMFNDKGRALSNEDDGFVLINRDFEYLKQATLDYFKQQGLELLTPQLSKHLWLDYVDHVQELDKERQNSQKKRISHVARSRSSQEKRDMIFSWPIERSRFWLSSFFGRRKLNGQWRFHYGLDMAAVRGTPVMAASSGVVVEACQARGYGKTIVIKHNQKYKTRYAHLDAIGVMVGQKIKRGDLIGRVGDTGFVRKSGNDASHLHFEVYVFGKRVNPLYFLA